MSQEEGKNRNKVYKVVLTGGKSSISSYMFPKLIRARGLSSSLLRLSMERFDFQDYYFFFKKSNSNLKLFFYI